MKPIIVKKEFSSNGEYYFKGDELKGLKYNTIIKLNEKGFIEPLSLKDLKEYKEGKKIPKI